MRQLPLNCEVYYIADFLGPAEAESLYHEITTGFDVTNRVIIMADGSEIVTGNGNYLFCHPELTSFKKLHETFGARAAWTDSLIGVRERIYEQTGHCFDVASCNYYQDGADYIDFHHDLPAFGPTDHIASLSLGAEREFVIRSINDPTEIHSLVMASGSLIFMGEGCQERFEHSVPPDLHCTKPRLNLSFRKYRGQGN